MMKAIIRGGLGCGIVTYLSMTCVSTLAFFLIGILLLVSPDLGSIERGNIFLIIFLLAVMIIIIQSVYTFWRNICERR